MNYTNHALRTNIQEWKNRLYRSTYKQFGHQLQFFFSSIEKSNHLSALISEAVSCYPQTEAQLETITDKIEKHSDFKFSSEIEQAAICFQLLKYFAKELGSFNVHESMIFGYNDFEATKSEIIDNYIAPITNYFHDKLDKSNSTIFLLEKYKKRTEWFTKKELTKLYSSASKSYEQIFEDDLRLFLFDQGIEYPFSTPQSVSGRADIIGEIETNDPLIIEIKIFDRERGYGKDRIKEGFAQIVKYAQDYNKDVGYLVIFNMDNVEINFTTGESDRTFPPSFMFNNKTFYFIVVNALVIESASKIGSLKAIDINVQELTKK